MSPRYQSITLVHRTVHTMFGSLIVLALIYCVVLLSLVFSVIGQKQNTLATRDLTSSLSTLEAQYANTVGSINDSTLSLNNYKRIDGATFAVRKDPIASYTVLYAR
jgi:hypothetical protein